MSNRTYTQNEVIEKVRAYREYARLNDLAVRDCIEWYGKNIYEDDSKAIDNTTTHYGVIPPLPRKRPTTTTRSIDEASVDPVRAKEYRILETVSGKFYVQVLHHTTTTKGYLWWKETIKNNEWVSVDAYGEVSMIYIMLNVDVQAHESFDNLEDAKEFIKRVMIGDVVHEV